MARSQLPALFCLLLVVACGRVSYDRVGEPDSATGDSGGLDSGLGDSGTRDSATDAARDSGAVFDSAGIDAATCAEAPCRLVAPQCGCPAGHACQRVDDARVCLPAGPTAAGTICSGTADCAAGSVCIAWGGRAYPGLCREHCATDADCLSSGRCLDEVGDPDVGVCGFGCNPLTDAGCPGALRCYTFGILHHPTGVAVLGTTCAGDEGAPVGSACARPRDCGPGTTCVSTGGPGACSTLCVDDGGCGGGLTCQELMPTTDVAGSPLGACL